MERLPISWWLAGASVAAMAVGAFGPWAKVTFGPVQATVEGGDDRWIVVGAAAVAAICLLAYLGRPRRWVGVPSLLAACAAGATAGYDVSDIESIASSTALDVSSDWGIYLALGGSIGLLAASLALIVQTRTRPE